MRVGVTTSGLKAGDVIKGAGRYAVVMSVYKNATGMPEAAVLYTDGRTSAWTDAPGSVSGLHLKVGEGCDTNRCVEEIRRGLEII